MRLFGQEIHDGEKSKKMYSINDNDVVFNKKVLHETFETKLHSQY